MAFEVPPLPYDYAALEPYIDEQTMHLHHDKHHQAYVDNANKALIDAGVKRFGSGWTWVVYDGTSLAVYSLPNQDSPIIQSDEPILGIDVWEHAYYLTYQNRRPEYLEAWWNVVNWSAVADRFERATAKERMHAS